jgi:hypothetical protein
MESVKIIEDIVYKAYADSSLAFDMYRPYNSERQILPVAIITAGYRTDAIDLTKFGPTTSWAKLIAASGFAAIIYETLDQKLDLEDLIAFLRENGDALNLDRDQFGLWTCSGNTPTALTFILESNLDYIKCGVIYYGLMLAEGWKHLDYWDSVGLSMSFLTPRVNWDSEINSNTPLLVVRAGLEHAPFLNQSIDDFLLKANERNLPVTFINFPDGHHGFDYKDDNDKSREIIKFTIEYFKSHLKNKE